MGDATITNRTKDGNGIRIFYRFTDGEERSEIFPLEYTRDQIREAIRIEVVRKNDLEALVESYGDLIGEVITDGRRRL